MSPSRGPTSGRTLVRLTGEGFGDRVEVRFGGEVAEVVSSRAERRASIVEVLSPSLPAGRVAVTLRNAEGVAQLPGGFLYEPPSLAGEADLTRLVRALLRALKRQLLEDTQLAVSVDYDADPADEVRVVAMATLPSVVVSGPRMRESRAYATNVAHEAVAMGKGRPELIRRRPAFTAELDFDLTVASERTAELLNLMAALTTFFNRNPWLSLERDPTRPELGAVRFEMDPLGEATWARRGGEVRAFSWGLRVRGFDVTAGQVMERSRAVSQAGLEPVAPLPGEST